MQSVELLRKLSAIYKAKPSQELAQAWQIGLDDLDEEQIEEGFKRMVKEFKSDFLPTVAVFRSYAQRDIGNRTQACKTPEEWLTKEAEFKATGNRLDPVGGQKFFQSIGRAPFGFWLDEDSIVRWTKTDEKPVKTEKPSKTDLPSEYFAKLVRTVAA
jgi:hypothetical protein